MDNRRYSWLLVPFALFTSCSESTEPKTTPACEPACDMDACQYCDTSLTEPACVALCAESAVCNAGKCEAPPAPATCEPACGECEVCDTAGAAPTCTSLCADTAVCNAGKCEPPPPVTCDPACGPCQTCDISGAVPVCADNCAADLLCQDGECVAPPAIVCDPACGACEMCDTTGAAPACVKLCGTGATCDTSSNACVAVGDFHELLGAPGKPLHGPFANGYAVSAACVSCHPTAAADLMKTPHWTWAGSTPDLFEPDGVTPKNPGNIGKKNLINNFCVAVPSNEKRCDQCHAGYGGDPDAAKAQKSARDYTSNAAGGDSSIPLENRVDCLVCHSNPATGYAKDPKNFGNPMATVNLAVAAQDITMPTRSNCGSCHFYAGGADSVKLMGSALKNPSEAIDVHMGRGMECQTCHVAPGHDFKGGGVHTPAHGARVSCSDCHTDKPHEGKVTNGTLLDTHANKVACQTCHIPTFSRGQFTKMDWDWSTAGDNQTCAGTPGTCTAGVVTVKVANDGVTPDPTSTTPVTAYDTMKGNFLWKKNVVPAYRWSNGKGTHYTTADKHSASLGLTAADDQRINLGTPLGNVTSGKIMPFKLMRGRQAVFVDGANSTVLTPTLFGPGAFWTITTAVGFQYSTYDYDGAAGPIAPGQPSVDALWGKVLAMGAIAAGQKPAGTTALPKWNPATPSTAGWDWRYTKLYMDMNHEVAPKAQALGKVCTDCHSTATPKIPICELYGNAPPEALGVVCP